VTGRPHQVFITEDTDLTKQIKIKEIRAANKTASTGFTKKNIADRVWKYRYLPPALENEYFERNVGDNKDVTKIRPLQPVDLFKRREYNELPPSSFTTPSFKSSYLT
jgi:hypothetical protein